MEQIIVVESKGNKTKGKVTEKTEVRIPTNLEVETAIQVGMVEVANIAAGKVEDPTMKHCSSCLKMGRQPFHPLTEFSPVKATGKPHSQCKTCRSEQACEWQLRRKAARAEYQRNYQKTRAPKPRIKKNDIGKVMTDAMAKAEPTDTPTQVDGMEAMFVAYVKPGEDGHDLG